MTPPNSNQWVEIPKYSPTDTKTEPSKREITTPVDAEKDTVDLTEDDKAILTHVFEETKKQVNYSVVYGYTRSLLSLRKLNYYT